MFLAANVVSVLIIPSTAGYLVAKMDTVDEKVLKIAIFFIFPLFFFSYFTIGIAAVATVGSLLLVGAARSFTKQWGFLDIKQLISSIQKLIARILSYWPKQAAPPPAPATAPPRSESSDSSDEESTSDNSAPSSPRSAPAS